jgi:hypothetical protein
MRRTDTGTGPQRRKGPFALLAGALVALLGVAGCAPDSAGATAAAEDFRRAVADGDASAACAMLSEHSREKAAAETSCEERLASSQLSVDGAALQTGRYGRYAIVEFPDDTMFLTVSGSRWLVTGAGCEQRGEAPYDCELGG